MDTLASLIERRAPVSPDCACAEAAARFAADPAAMLLAVTEDDRPVGLVGRDLLLALADDPRPVREVMDASPLVAPAEAAPWSFREQALAESPEALSRGFIAVEDGRYLGVGTAVALMNARRPRATRAQQDPTSLLIQRMSEEVLRHLDGVADFTARLLRQQLSPDAQACVRAIAETGDDLNVLMRRAVDLHEADLGALAFSRRPCRLQDLMDGLDARWKGRAAAAGLTLLTAYDGDPEYAAQIDDGRLMQVFDALVFRALSETRRGAVEVSLKARPTAEGLLLEGRVRDAGGDLSPERLAHIFAPLGETATDHPEGLSAGLGMALAARIITAADGVIRAESNPGVGVTVTFELIAPQAAVEIQAADDAVEGPARTAHVLIVDDNATNRMVAEALCEMFDCTSEQAVDGVEALEAVKARHFDLILMDIKMPRMDGVAATRAIRDLPGTAARTPIIALTANADPEDVRGYLEAGMNDVVEKPIKAERMLAALQAALEAVDAASAAA
ncbi:response regulator [Caulobacter mirabilis]|uniref:Hybrid sensor histidine kinase/response regulator n=1 Tax=Caulobacter mirabilis TaxID=69666 RepID=A0A2D2AV85_9CAUL|nr:response regulator [Caulobacter mirabilis]ATQ41914.1 hybrid sensor histidine kinase/response regulator [Caulobacter mirabilis]